MNILAKELNAVLDGTVAERLLSSFGKRMYFPKGIIAQSAEAKKHAHTANATIGMAFANGKPLRLSAVQDAMPAFSPAESVAYSPTAGLEAARKAWQAGMLDKNPSLRDVSFSLPAVVPGLTAGISYIADLFLDEGTPILVSDPCWDNYKLVFEDRSAAAMHEIPFFSADGTLDTDGIRKAMEKEAESGAVRIIFNFPNNPSGYSPTKKEAEALLDAVRSIAEKGAAVLVICDDAYFGLAYEDDIYEESLFGKLASMHKNILAIKIDGPTKEDYVWGLRMGFVTFGSAGIHDYDPLVKKLMGAIRSSVSCTNTPAQNLMLKTAQDPRTPDEKKQYKILLQKRYQAVKKFLVERPAHPVLEALPFNSGYFMSFRCKGVSAEAIRTGLLQKHGIGTIALGASYLRIAFSSVDEEKIEDLYAKVYAVAAELA